MNDPAKAQLEALAHRGIDALRRGDADTARQAFAAITASGRASPQIWLFLAQACDMADDRPAARAALQRDVAPALGSGAGMAKVVFIVFALMVLAVVLSTCGGKDCDDVRRTFGAASTEYQQCERSAGSGYRGSGGGSYGGWSSGGGHK